MHAVIRFLNSKKLNLHLSIWHLSYTNIQKLHIMAFYARVLPLSFGGTSLSTELRLRNPRALFSTLTISGFFTIGKFIGYELTSDHCESHPIVEVRPLTGERILKSF